MARFIFAFAVDEEDGSSVITQTKNSLGRSDLPSLAYRIIEATVPTAKGDARVGRFVLDGPSERTVQDILSDQGGEQRDAKTRAEDYLREALAAGPRPTKDVTEEAREVADISEKTLKRARSALRIPAAKRADGWWISLPEHEGDLRNPPESETPSPAKSAKGAKTSSPRHVGPLGPLDAKPAKPANPSPLDVPGGVGGLEPSPDRAATLRQAGEDTARVADLQAAARARRRNRTTRKRPDDAS